MSAHVPSLRLIIRGDDAGATRGSNEALLACARAGLVRNVGFMACAPAFDHAAQLFREPPPGVVLGLHATVTSEWNSSLRWGPVLPRDQVPSLLAADGNFVHTTKTLYEQADHNQIIDEVRAQIRKARRAGLRIAYLDTHMAFTWIPGMQARINDLALEEGLVPDQAGANGIHQRLPKAKVTSADPAEEFRRRVEAASPGNYVAVFHPSLLDDDALLMRAADSDDPASIGRQRAAEAALLTESSTGVWLRDRGVVSIVYS